MLTQFDEKARKQLCGLLGLCALGERAFPNQSNVKSQLVLSDTGVNVFNFQLPEIGILKSFNSEITARKGRNKLLHLWWVTLDS